MAEVQPTALSVHPNPAAAAGIVQPRRAAGQHCRTADKRIETGMTVDKRIEIRDDSHSTLGALVERRQAAEKLRQEPLQHRAAANG